MYSRTLWLIAAVSFVMLGGPIAMTLGKVNVSDPFDLYLMIELDAHKPPDPQIIRAGAVEVGPERARFARMIFAPPNAKAELLAAGYVVLPAGAFAALCGFDAELPYPTSRDA